MKKKIVALGFMIVLSVTAVAGCGQKTGVETTAQIAVKSTAVDTTATNTVADTTQADAAGVEVTAVAQSDNSYQYISAGDAVAAAKDKDAHVLGIGEWDDYMEGRVTDSVWRLIFLSEDDSLADAMNTYVKENLGDGKKIYIICNSGKRGAKKTTGALREAGVDSSLIYTVKGRARTLESEKDALTTNRIDEDVGWKTATTTDTLKVMEGSDVQILDVRDNDTYAEGHLRGSLQCPLREIEDPTAQTVIYEMAKEEMGPSRPVYLLCYSGSKCAKTDIFVMKDAGFDVDGLFIIESDAKNKDIQAAFMTG